jgi:hypothetical protein
MLKVIDSVIGETKEVDLIHLSRSLMLNSIVARVTPDGGLEHLGPITRQDLVFFAHTWATWAFEASKAKPHKTVEVLRLVGLWLQNPKSVSSSKLETCFLDAARAAWDALESARTAAKTSEFAARWAAEDDGTALARAVAEDDRAAADALARAASAVIYGAVAGAAIGAAWGAAVGGADGAVIWSIIGIVFCVPSAVSTARVGALYTSNSNYARAAARAATAARSSFLAAEAVEAAKFYHAANATTNAVEAAFGAALAFEAIEDEDSPWRGNMITTRAARAAAEAATWDETYQKQGEFILEHLQKTSQISFPFSTA